MINGKIYTAKVAPIIEKPIALRQIAERNVDEKYYIKDNFEKWKYLKGGKKIPKKTKDGFEYMYSEGPIAFPDPLDLPARTMLTSEGGVSRMSHAVHCLKASEEYGKLMTKALKLDFKKVEKLAKLSNDELNKVTSKMM